MTVEALLKPRGPYSLRLSGGLRSDATRRVWENSYDGLLEIDGLPERVQAQQGPDGRILVRAPGREAVERLAAVLGLENDHSEFLRRFRADPLLGRATKLLAGHRPMRLGSVAQALLRALCGQLIEARRARALERRIIAAACPSEGRFHTPPSAEALGRFSAAELRAMGLHERRSATLLRLCRSLDLDRLAGAPRAAARLERERGLGPWSAGVISLEGLGRYDVGLVGDLGLIKLLRVLRGRPVESWETRELLEPYGEWAGLASVYLLSGWARGLLPVPPALYRAA
jgi:AraC family transcriptional regulator of adaptative response / DNA-3-methyladenine glycosylase II